MLVPLDHIFRGDCPKQLQNNIPSTDWILSMKFNGLLTYVVTENILC